MKKMDLSCYTLTPKAILTMHILLKYVNYQTKECWPSLRTIAKDAHCSMSSVQRALRELLANGLIKKQERHRPDGSQTSNVYIIIMDTAAQAAAAAENMVLLGWQKLQYMRQRQAAADARAAQLTMLTHHGAAPLSPSRRMTRALQWLHDVPKSLKNTHLTRAHSQMD